MVWLRSLSVAARLALAAGLVGLIALAGWYVFLRPQQAAQKTAEAKTEAVEAKAQAGATTDTLHIVVDRQAAEVRIVKTTEENTRAIMASPGATTELDPLLHAAGIRALCVHDNVDQLSCSAMLQRDGDGGGAR